MRLIILFCTLLIALGVFVARYADQFIVNPDSKSIYSDAWKTATRSSSSSVTIVNAPPPEPPRSSASEATTKPAMPQVIRMSPSGRSVILNDDGRGRFKVEGRVDGLRINFLVDTGATSVALRESTAAKLGIHPARSDYTSRIQTANGQTFAAPVQLKSIEIGDIVVRDVRAYVQPDDKLHVDLLGMTFLSRVRWTHDRGRLVIEQ
jgi:aspartyl protease family protein